MGVQTCAALTMDIRNDFRDLGLGVARSLTRCSFGGYWNTKRRLEMAISDPFVKGEIVGLSSAETGRI